ncbi:pulmonary surfactant-associated protein B [Porphyrio hochstetteri]
MAPPPPPALPLLLLALLGAPPGLGEPGVRCGVPPTAWCQSLETALRCGALGHCARHAWAAPDTDICADCQQVVTILTRMANESAVKAAVEGSLQRECAALPVPSLVPPCQRLVHDLCSRLLAGLEGQLKPSAICAHLDLCPGGALAVSPLAALSTHLQAGAALPMPLPLCWLCRTFLARAEAAVPKEKLAAAAAELCRALPVAVAGACQCLAQRYAALGLEWVLGRLGPRLLCRLLLSCRPEEPVAPPAPPRDTQGPLAMGCGSTLQDPPMLSPDPGPCAQGPTYWCSSPEAAQRCQALQHCQDHVWV